MNITKINKCIKNAEEHFYNEYKKQVYSQIKIHLKNINIIKKYKNLNMTEHKAGMNIDKYKKLIMTEHKTDMNITKYKKLTMIQQKPDMNINTKIYKYKKTERQFYDGAQNRYEHF